MILKIVCLTIDSLSSWKEIIPKMQIFSEMFNQASNVSLQQLKKDVKNNKF